MEEQRQFVRRKADNCPFKYDIHDLSEHMERVDTFMRDMQPLIAYVKADIERKKDRSNTLRKISIVVLAAWVISLSALLFTWLKENLFNSILEIR